jgi:prepilin-type N-terminal cleavage/methylation domain-containing protein
VAPKNVKNLGYFGNETGFSVLEILVALAIVAILAAMATAAYVNSTSSAETVDAIATISVLEEQLQLKAEVEGPGNACDNQLVSAGGLENVFMDMNIVPFPLDANDLSKGYGAGLSVSSASDKHGSEGVKATRLLWEEVSNQNKVTSKPLLSDSIVSFAVLLTHKSQPFCSATPTQIALQTSQQPQPPSQTSGSVTQATTLQSPKPQPTQSQITGPATQGTTTQVKAPSGPAPITSCPGTLKLGSDGRCHTSNTPLPTHCPEGQDCSHHDSQCPVGQEHIAATSVPVRGSHNPWSTSTGATYSTKSQAVPAGCVAKCKAGFVFNPKNPSSCTIAPSTNNHTCRGPKFICERSHVPQGNSDGGACTADAPYAANHVENLKDGSRYVTRSCVTQQEAFDADQYNKNHPNCKNYNVVVLQDAHFKCTFPCHGDACNLETVPDHPATWSNGKTATDLPDQFD